MALQIHESVGHAVELDRILGWEAAFAGTSWLDLSRLGSLRFGSDLMTITADATLPGALGSFGYDDEGTPAGPVDIVRDGIWVGVLSGRDSAATGGLRRGRDHRGCGARPADWRPARRGVDRARRRGRRAVGSGAAAAAVGPGIRGPARRPAARAAGQRLLVHQGARPRTVVVTGLTRNGVHLVEAGEITRAVTNLRFTQSYPDALGPGAVLALGPAAAPMPERAPGAPTVTPSLRLARWHMTGGAAG